ncbi:MAG: cytochrome c1 [Burkholderiales bacterium]|nr:cytochrome c1 [Burkholderiales bacterium]MDE1928114.1 cytochrome c1 [Burkholderiales bacterium]MDE2159260.1 cytochrome c1 [Burkholderiales bacterium]MDE2502216.1 cytochrome c1 [Burkholderiales bacterium]
MKKLITTLLAALALAGAAHAEGPVWDRFPTEKMSDMVALQRGAKLFTNYCLTCHAASYMRYNKLEDIGLTQQQIKDNLVFTGVKTGELMKVAMDPNDAKDWFGAAPPDLTLVARSRAEHGKGSGADYLYSYLRSFYRDDTKTTGWNNLIFPSVAMPNVLWQLQGQRRAVFEDEKNAETGEIEHVFKGFEPITQGTMTPAEFNDNIADLVAYLKWMSEPAQGERVRIGVWVLIFLAFFTVIAWRLNAAYWKDIK